MGDKEEIKRLRLEIESLKKDRDEWEESAHYWSGEYDEEHNKCMEFYNELTDLYESLEKLIQQLNNTKS